VVRLGLDAGLVLALVAACGGEVAPADTGAGDNVPAGVDAGGEIDAESVFWNSATVYFLLTDRFENGDPTNDNALGRPQDGAVLRSFEGGDLRGLLQRIESGWFDSLGVNVIWTTPFLENNRGSVDEGTGKSYGFHGYWTRDWTAVEPALGTVEDLRAVVDAAHARGIRVLMDAVINHTGPVTAEDPQWPADWVRTSPHCQFRDYESTVDCTLVANLPDILTSSDEPVELPQFLLDKWEREGRLDDETAELDAYFERTGHPRAPRYYLIKWLTDWVREIGFDGYRVDTAKHFEEAVSAELKAEASQAYDEWKTAHPDQVVGDLPFYMMGEVYNYHASSGRDFDFGDGTTVDFFDFGYDGLINFGLKQRDIGMPDVFAEYSSLLHGPFGGVAILNYISSHDDGSPYDPLREDPLGAGTRLLLAPGGAQIYYGDELARPLQIEGAQGDANLRSFMNWSDLGNGSVASDVLEHWRKLGRFRREHPAVGIGIHATQQDSPYVFSRTLNAAGTVDRIVVAIGAGPGEVTIPVGEVFPDGTTLVDGYTGDTAVVTGGAVTLATESGVILLGDRR
jgi:alpha-amylase